MKKSIAVFGMAFAAVVIFFCLNGCAQNQEPRTSQTPNQDTPATQDQDQATQGSSVTVTQHNNNGGAEPQNIGTTSQPAYDAEQLAFNSPAGGMALGKSKGNNTYNTQINYIQTGGTTPSLTGSNAATGTQTPTQRADSNATQHPESAASGTVAVALPAGNASAAGTAANRGNAETNKQDQIDQRVARIEATQEKLATSLAKLMEFLAAPPPTTQPVGTMELVPGNP